MKKPGLPRKSLGPQIAIELKPTWRQVRVASALVAMLSLPLELGSETITFSTTYPSPVGIYNRILTTGASASNNNTILARDGGSVGIGTTQSTHRLVIKGYKHDWYDSTMALYVDEKAGNTQSAVINFFLKSTDLSDPYKGATIGVSNFIGGCGDNVQPGDLSIASMLGQDIHLVSRTRSDYSPTRLFINNDGNGAL